MKLVKKIKNKGNLIYSDIPESNIIVTKKKQPFYSHIEYYNEIKNKGVENGKYMIKKYELKYLRNWNRLAFGKSYFCYADRGTCFTYERKKPGIFYLNNFKTILGLVKRLIYNNNNELYCIVNRKTGKNTYIVPSYWFESELYENSLLIIK